MYDRIEHLLQYQILQKLEETIDRFRTAEKYKNANY